MDPTLGVGAGAGVFLGRRGISREDAWSLPRRSSAAATLLPIASGGGVRRLARWLAEEVELLGKEAHAGRVGRGLEMVCVGGLGATCGR